MKLIGQSVELLTKINYEDAIRLVEGAGRTCYKSERDTSIEQAENFIKGIVKRGHESVIEHLSLSFRIITDRGVSHQIVRHRIASYSQESTRYCNYTKDKFGNEITFIKPFADDEKEEIKEAYKKAAEEIEKNYFALIELGAPLDLARSVLPNSVKTELVMTANAREWRHFLKLRTKADAHYQIREISNMIKDILVEKYPAFFEDLD